MSADLLSGEFDEATQVFTPNGDVTHFNTPGDEWALSVSRDLLTATFDSPNGVMWARRSTPTQPFGQPAPVLNVPAGYIDPTLCTVNGNLHLMYVWGIDLWIGRFADGVLYDTWLLAAKPPTSDFAHSPSPMTTADGETEALVFAAYTSGMGSQPYFQSDLDATRGTPAHQLLNRPSNWLANPDANGGRVRYAEAIAGYGDPVELELVAVASTEASTDGGAGALELVVFAPTRSGAQSTMLGTVALGVLGAGPLPLPFLGGSALSLDPSSLVTLPPALLDRNSGTLRYRLDLPPTPELTLHAVPLVFDGQRGFLGNAGVVTLKAKESKCAEPEVMMPAANGSCQPGYRLMNLIRISGGSVRSTTGCYKCTGGCANGTCQPVIVTLVGIPGSQADVVRCYCR